MTETELQQRLSATVEDIDAPSDLVDRARQGGARRLRRRRFTSLAVAALAVVAVGGVAIASDNLLDQRAADSGVAAVPGPGDPYGFLMNRAQGDLIDDQAYLDQVLATWDSSHAKSLNNSRGLFDDFRGAAKVAWAGNTPAGRAAIVVQQSFLHNHSDIQLDHEGIYTLVGFIGEGADGKPTLVSDGYPAPGVGLITGFVTGASKEKALVVLDTGKRMGWSTGRVYADDGSSRHDYFPLTFRDGVSIEQIPAGTDLGALRISPLPATGRSDQYISVPGVPVVENQKDPRMWQEPVDALWPMTAGADSLRKWANDTFVNAVTTVEDPAANGAYMSLWTAYGKTADGSQVLLGEHALDTDPSRVYAVLKTRTGKTTIIPGGIPDRNATLPVCIKLPNAQGWALAAKDATLTYRLNNGSWSTPRKDALLVPDASTAEVKVTLHGTTKTIPLN